MAIKVNLLRREERKKPSAARAAFKMPSLPGGAGQKLGIVVVVVLVLGSAAWWVGESYRVNALRKDITTLRAKDAQLQRQLVEVRALEAAKKEIQRRLDIIGRVAKAQGVPVDMMNAVLRSVPQGIWLTALEVRPQEVRVKVDVAAAGRPLVGSSETLAKLEEKKAEATAAPAPGTPGARPAATKEVTEIKGFSVVIKGNAFNNFQVADFMSNLKKAGVFADVDFNVTQAASVEQIRVMSFEVTAAVNL
ncbi:MAG: PilN domain-containing protein [Candidatus Rokubacteria bacterium]|nr:PilN domain-containing protein [Candidatus Rokubacteria bacterium]